MDDIRLEYVKLDKEEEKYKIYHNGKLLDVEIVVNHIKKNISFLSFCYLKFSYKNDYDIERLTSKIFKLFEEYVLPEYKEYKIEYEATVGNESYWNWKNNNDDLIHFIM